MVNLYESLIDILVFVYLFTGSYVILLTEKFLKILALLLQTIIKIVVKLEKL